MTTNDLSDVKSALLVFVAVLLCLVAWEEGARRYEVYDISSSNCCSRTMTVIVLDTWTGKMKTWTVPNGPSSWRK